MKTIKMNRMAIGVAITLLLGGLLSASATTYYVSPTGNDLYNGTSPMLSRKTIQSAVDSASAGDTVLVYAGTYSSGTTTRLSSLNRVVIEKDITVISASGPDVTFIEGSQGSTSVRGVYMSAGTLSGFTVRNGKAINGGGIYCSGNTPVTTNCIVSGNTAVNAGGMYYGTAMNCTFSENTVTTHGGGMYEGIATDCTFNNNTATDNGGGMYYGIANHCDFSGNEATDGGGAYNITANYCTFTENEADRFGGGMSRGTAESCLFIDNDATDDFGDGSGGGMYDGVAINCTFSKNSSGYGGGMNEGIVYNCIIWGNSARTGSNLYNTEANYSCSPDLRAGVSNGSISDDPLFIDAAAGNYRLQNTSPCINEGSDSIVNLATDLDGNTRKQNSSVDMGAYETTLTHYVRGWTASPSWTPQPPYTTWETAASTIQYAVDVADDGATVLVSNGTYQAGSTIVGNTTLGTRVVIEKNITVRSVNGPEVTIIKGAPEGSSGVRGVYLIDDCTLSGFTVTGCVGHVGGGIWCVGTFGGTAVVTNCIISGNSSYGDGGGMDGGIAIDCIFSDNTASQRGGGMGSYGTAINCTFTNNTASQHGGGMYGGSATDCTFSGNTATGDGGGMYEGSANNCTFTDNSATKDGGGMYKRTANNCTFINNEATVNGGGMCYGTANNCYFYSNDASGSGGGIFDGMANNCTIYRNRADVYGSGSGGGMFAGTANNCIVWGNSAKYGDDLLTTTATDTCSPDVTSGSGNITTDPQFFYAAEGDCRLLITSPCIDTGDNSVVSSGDTDLDGNPRTLNGTVDMGAYEVDAEKAALTHYVRSGNGAAQAPYTTWATAASTIQDAVDAAYYSGPTVLVTNGTYNTGTTPATGDSDLSRVVIEKDITVRSVNGADVTIIEGSYSPAVRGVKMKYGTLTGFTVRNGKSGEFRDGGGIYCYDNISVISHCIISGNEADFAGGGMYSGTANNCTFSGNKTTKYNANHIVGGGGGMYGGIANNCTFSGNKTTGSKDNNFGDGGGGMCGRYDDAIANNCTFSDNETLGDGGGVSYVTANNCIIYGNDADGSGDNVNGGTLNSCYTADPLFVDDANGNYRLQSTSPCINAGNDALVVGTTDLDGNARIVHGTVDMGAYEYYGLLSSSAIFVSGIDGSTVNFGTSNGRQYTLWWSTNLVEGIWTTGGSVSGDGTEKSLTGPDVSSPSCFYQVKEQ